MPRGRVGTEPVPGALRLVGTAKTRTRVSGFVHYADRTLLQVEDPDRCMHFFVFTPTTTFADGLTTTNMTAVFVDVSVDAAGNVLLVKRREGTTHPGTTPRSLANC